MQIVQIFHKQNAGFTLIEVLLAVMIMIVMVGAAVPGIQSIQNYIMESELDSAAMVLTADIRWLQQYSRSLDSSSLCFLLFNTVTEPHEYYIVLNNTKVLKKVSLGQFGAVELQGVCSPLRFSQGGAPIGNSNSYSIGLRHKKTKTLRILTILPVTGRVTVSKN